MPYLFQRVVPNEFGWAYPSPGRLKDLDSEDIYLDFTGFGHEDWNFNLGFALDGWLYGYLYYEPTNPQSRYDIAFALYEPGDGWFLAGFYINAEFVVGGAPTNNSILAQKAHHLQLLEDAHSLGREYIGMSDAERITKLRKAATDYKWRVRPKNAIALKTPIRIPDHCCPVR